MGVMPPKPMRENAEEVVLSRADWEALLNAIEDADDIAAVAAARAEDAVWAAAAPEGLTTRFPHEVVSAELDGAHPLAAWRKYRELTQRGLGERAGVTRDLIAQIEARRKQGSIDTLSRLAQALSVPIEAIIDAG
jgi:DNA-binding XRE family transcriptional regulator